MSRDIPSLVDRIGSETAAPAALSLVGIANVLLRNRYLIVGTALAIPLYVGLTALSGSRVYTARASFVPQNSATTSPASGLAAQLGLGGALADASQSPQFYADLLTSDELLRTVAATPYHSRFGSTLSDALVRRDVEATLKEYLGISALRRRMRTSVSTRTGVVEVRVTTPSPELSALIASRLLEALNHYNLQKRRSRATAEREFTEQRLSEAATALRGAEQRLLSFLQQNRDVSSPSLAAERDRLSREVTVRQELYTTLARAREQARIEEVRNSPVVSIIEQPRRPVVPDSRRVPRRVVFALFFGITVGIGAAVVREQFRRASDHPSEEAADFARLRADAISDVRHPLRSLRTKLSAAKRSATG